MLLSIADYRRLAGDDDRQDIGELLWMAGADDIEFEIPRDWGASRPVDFG